MKKHEDTFRTTKIINNLHQWPSISSMYMLNDLRYWCRHSDMLRTWCSIFLTLFLAELIVIISENGCKQRLGWTCQLTALGNLGKQIITLNLGKAYLVPKTPGRQPNGSKRFENKGIHQRATFSPSRPDLEQDQRQAYARLAQPLPVIFCTFTSLSVSLSLSLITK